MSLALPPLELVVACGRGGVIGHQGRLPWHLPDELKRFRELTWGQPLLMGRRTYDSIGRPLPGRISRVLSRDPGFRAAGVEVYPDLASAWAASRGAAALMVVGGAEIYAQTLPLADRLLLTEVEAEVAGDVFFPALDFAAWDCVDSHYHPADDRHPFGYTQRDWRRRVPLSAVSL